MDNEIDSLSFKVKITGVTNKTIENLNLLGKALEYLNDVVKKLDFSQLEYLQNVKVSIGIGKSLTAMAIGLEKVDKALSKANFEKLASLKAPINFYQISNQQIKQTEEGAKALNEIAEAQEKIANNQKIAGKSGTFLEANGSIQKLKTKTQAPIEVTKSLDELIKKNKELSKVLEASGGIFNVVDDPKKIKVSKELKEQIKGNKELMNLLKQQNAVLGDEDEKGSGGSKGANRLVKSLKRIKLIAFIKLVRGALNAIIKGFQSGIQSLAKYSKEFNGTMSQMVTAFEQIKASIALIAQPFVEALLPVVQAFSSSLIEISNAISKANAMAKGLTTYTRVSADYAKDYAQSMQQGSLFSFDTFETLNAQQSPYETAEIGEEENTEVNNLLETISLIKETGETIAKLLKPILSYIGKILNAIMPILDIVVDISNKATEDLKPAILDLLEMVVEVVNNLAPLITNIFEALRPIIDIINAKLLPSLVKILSSILVPISEIIGKLPIGEIVELIAKILVPAMEILDSVLKSISDDTNDLFVIIKDILNLIQPVLDLIIALWKGDTKGFEQSIKNIGKMILQIFAKIIDFLVNSVIRAINTIIANDFVKKIVNFFGGDWEGITWRLDLSGKLGEALDLISFANGGIVGEIWQMNEYGNPEMLYNSSGSSSNTAVITQVQLAQAFEEAIYRTGIIQAIEDDKYVVIDGKAVAQSSSFKREINRTNPKLALK